MQAIHQIFAVAALIAVVIGVVWAAVLAITRRPGGRAFARAQAVLVGIVALAAIGGALVFLTGSRPADGLHLVYGAVAILVIPFARSFLRAEARRDALVLFVAAVVLGGVIYRLFATG